MDDVADEIGEESAPSEMGDKALRGKQAGAQLPNQPRIFVRSEVVKAAFTGAPPIDAAAFKRDIDRFLDQDPTPRG